MRKNLVIVRAGDASRHHTWLDTCPADKRNWDIMVSGYGTKPVDKRAIDRYHHVRAAKWNGLYHSIKAHEEYVFAHERIMLADDDLVMTGEDLNNLFSVGEALDLHLYQPAILGQCGHAVLRCRRDCLIRYVAFVEVMAPVLHRKSLRFFWRDFKDMRSGCGMDMYWGAFARFPHMAVVDCVPVRHPARPASNRPGQMEWLPSEELFNGFCRHFLEMARFCVPQFAPEASERTHFNLVTLTNDMTLRLVAALRLRDNLRHPLPQLAEIFKDYALGKDWDILKRADRRARLPPEAFVPIPFAPPFLPPLPPVSGKLKYLLRDGIRRLQRPFVLAVRYLCARWDKRLAEKYDFILPPYNGSFGVFCRDLKRRLLCEWRKGSVAPFWGGVLKNGVEMREEPLARQRLTKNAKA